MQVMKVWASIQHFAFARGLIPSSLTCWRAGSSQIRRSTISASIYADLPSSWTPLALIRQRLLLRRPKKDWAVSLRRSLPPWNALTWTTCYRIAQAPRISSRTCRPLSKLRITPSGKYSVFSRICVSLLTVMVLKSRRAPSSIRKTTME